MSTYSAPGGPPPKPASQRRRRNKPASYGAANPATAPAADPAARALDIDNPHPLAVALWDTVWESCEAAFYSDADWHRLRLELFYANTVLTGGREMTPSAWSTVQSGLNEMLLSPAIKRRAGIEVKPQAVDADDVAAVSLVGRYQEGLKSV